MSNKKDKNTEELLEKEGVKFDGEKVRVELLPVSAIRAYGGILTHGAKKYSDRNWEKGMKWSRLYGACLRHLTAFWDGENLDPESGYHHLASAIFNIGGLIEFTITKPDLDDRPNAPDCGNIRADTKCNPRIDKEETEHNCKVGKSYPYQEENIIIKPEDFKEKLEVLLKNLDKVHEEDIIIKPIIDREKLKNYTLLTFPSCTDCEGHDCEDIHEAMKPTFTSIVNDTLILEKKESTIENLSKTIHDDFDCKNLGYMNIDTSKPTFYLAGCMDEPEYRERSITEYGHLYNLIDPLKFNDDKSIIGETLVKYEKHAIRISDATIMFLKYASNGTCSEGMYTYMLDKPLYVINPNKKFFNDMWLEYHATEMFESIEECFAFIWNKYLNK